MFSDQLRRVYGEGAFAQVSGASDIRLLKTDSIKAEEAYNAEESFSLEILADGITLNAATGTGMYRGLQTLRQLFLSGYNDGVLSLPLGVIEDRPRFPWRGLMLDCSRYFYSVEFIKKLLDGLTLQHINIFHWHLTDDQGWRLPVEAYPLLI